MELTPQDAFKLGFAARCAEEGLTGVELEARLDKVAEFNKRAAFGYKSTPTEIKLPVPGISSIAGGAGDIGAAYLAALTVPFGASILGGSALGYGAGKMTEPRVDEDELRARELADTYKLYAEKAKQRKKLRQYRLRDGNL